jgi:hypothetical protein
MEIVAGVHLAPLIALIAGVLILIVPRLLNFIVAIYLIIVGLLGLFPQLASWVLRARRIAWPEPTRAVKRWNCLAPRCGNRAIALGEAFRYQRDEGSAREFPMADHTPTGPVELGAEMDYAEHDKTYHRFLTLAKYGSLVVAALLIAMAFGFFTSAGFFSGTVLFILVCVVGYFLLRDLPGHIT